MSKRIYIVETKDHSGWWAILAEGALLVFLKYVLILAIVAATIWLVVEYDKNKKAKEASKPCEEMMAGFRAAHADMLYDMEAPTQLLTEGMRVWGDPEHYINDYDDGMRNWR
jgi:hypothetical protein